MRPGARICAFAGTRLCGGHSMMCTAAQLFVEPRTGIFPLCIINHCLKLILVRLDSAWLESMHAGRAGANGWNEGVASG